MSIDLFHIPSLSLFKLQTTTSHIITFYNLVHLQTSIPMKLGRCVKCKKINKKITEYNDLQILFNLYSIECTTETRYLMFKLIQTLLFCKYSLILNLMPATHPKRKTLNKHLGTEDTNC